MGTDPGADGEETFFCSDEGAGDDVRLGMGTTADLSWKEAIEGKIENSYLLYMEMSLNKWRFQTVFSLRRTRHRVSRAPSSAAWLPPSPA